LAIIFVGAMYAPMPIYGLWLVRFVTREAALFGMGLALLLALVVKSRRHKAAAGGLAILATLPALAPIPTLWSLDTHFSLRQYAGGGPQPEVQVTRDVLLEPGQPSGNPDLLADIYHGSGPAPHPFVIVIHGGSWIHGDKGDVPQVSRHLAATGTTVVDVRYRLSPQYPFPAAVQDVKCALGRLREQSSRLQLDPHRAAYLGRSAGGELALVAAYSAGDGTLPPACAVADAPVQAVIAIYPAVDARSAYEHPPVPDPEETREVLLAYLGGPPNKLPANYNRANPAFYVAAQATRPLPPTLLLHGRSDMLVPVWHSERLYEKLHAAGQPASLITLPLAEHGFDFRSGGTSEQVERAAVTRFLRAAFTASPPAAH
jgi:acetyl esterase/lipase